MSVPTDSDIQKWHRYFAVEANNEAWQRSLDTESERRPDEVLKLAYVAAYHWSQCGTALNVFRANMLLAHAHAFCGHGQTACEYVARYRAYMSEHAVEGWELVFAEMIHAQAAWAAGDHALHTSMYEQAAAAIEAMSDLGDREIATLTWVNIPRP